MPCLVGHPHAPSGYHTLVHMATELACPPSFREQRAGGVCTVRTHQRQLRRAPRPSRISRSQRPVRLHMNKHVQGSIRSGAPHTRSLGLHMVMLQASSSSTENAIDRDSTRTARCDESVRERSSSLRPPLRYQGAATRPPPLDGVPDGVRFQLRGILIGLDTSEEQISARTQGAAAGAQCPL